MEDHGVFFPYEATYSLERVPAFWDRWCKDASTLGILLKNLIEMEPEYRDRRLDDRPAELRLNFHIMDSGVVVETSMVVATGRDIMRYVETRPI